MISWWRVKDWWYRNVSSRVFPRQRWLKIPRTWVDSDRLMETVVAQSLVFYWENDNGKESTWAQWQPEVWDDAEKFWGIPGYAAEQRAERKAVYDEMKAAYDWIKSKKDWYEVTDADDEEGQKHLDNIWKRRHYLWS